jgi:hypothetical protein
MRLALAIGHLTNHIAQENQLVYYLVIVIHKTKIFVVPARPVFDMDIVQDSNGVGVCNDMCEIRWHEPDNQGDAIIGYNIRFAMVDMNTENVIGMCQQGIYNE